MTFRTRILLVYLLLIGGGYVYLVGWILNGIRPRYLESMEESLVDTANILAAFVENRVVDGALPTDSLQPVFDAAYRRELDAQVYTVRKQSIDLRVYLTDASGVVRYDSDGGRAVGQDYSRWNDILRTLRGQYGARSTREIPDDESSQRIYVAAPVRHAGRIIGVLSVGKPTDNINDLVRAARQRVLVGGVAGGLLVIAVGVGFSIWLTTPLERLTAYVRNLRDGKHDQLPERLAGQEVGDLQLAFDEMRATLEGKQHVERYTEALAHQLKSPLAGIRGAAELLTDDTGAMPPEQRARFLSNITGESARIQNIIDRLLQLTGLEARPGDRDLGPVDLQAVLNTAARTAEGAAAARGIHLIVLHRPAATTNGEGSLIAQSLDNLVQNAIEFTPTGGTVTLSLLVDWRFATFTVDDTGPGIPAYARDKVYDRFFSLPRPDTGRKSSGLGLSLVREVARRHGGEFTITNRPQGGCHARLSIRLR